MSLCSKFRFCVVSNVKRGNVIELKKEEVRVKKKNVKGKDKSKIE